MSERDLAKRIRSAGALIDPGLTERDVDRLVHGALRRGRWRRRRRIALAAAVGLVAVLIGLHHRSDLRRAVSPDVYTATGSSPEPSPRILYLQDGSRVASVEATSEVALAEESAGRTVVKLLRGRARFEVARKPERLFVVQAPPVTITVIGTAFTVEQVADRVGVLVERGTVRVDWGVGSKLLEGGQTGWFPPLVVDTDVSPGPPAPRSAAPLPKPTRLRPAPPPETGEAVAVVPAERPASAEALLLAADAARAAGHPAQGARLLKQALEQYPSDPRGPLAAFSLGRVLLMDLAHPREAAAAFAEVRRLAPSGPFAEDALAREVEAWRNAGELARARERAEEYLRLYPGGHRAASVGAMGGIE